VNGRKLTSETGLKPAGMGALMIVSAGTGCVILVIILTGGFETARLGAGLGMIGVPTRTVFPLAIGTARLISGSTRVFISPLILMGLDTGAAWRALNSQIPERERGFGLIKFQPRQAASPRH